jgi:hypothetical protein
MGMSMEHDNHAATRATPARDRFAVLALRHAVSLGVLQSTSARDFAVVLAAAAQSFPEGENLSEREVNERLRAFLDDAGSMLATDHVELRRWLVDSHVLDRDGYGRVYTAGTPAPEIAQFMRELSGVDLAEFARGARASEAARRAERKARWQAAGRGEGSP